jgi:VWFA-related protein
MGHRRSLFQSLMTHMAGAMFLALPLIHLSAQTPPGSANDATVIRAETRLVLVDSVVTDKKGNYIRDLNQKDFKVWEDGKEQPITSFTYEESTGSGKPQPRYMVLFFDNSTMDFADQAKARDAAAKFIDANAGPDRLIAIAEFGGTVRISQNFTADAERLKLVVKGIKGSFVSPNGDPSATVASLAAPPMAPTLSNAENDFGANSVLLALRDMAKALSTVPGRKTLVMLTAGFPLNVEYQSELTAVVDSCNKANVAVYPIDVRGLIAPDLKSPQGRLSQPIYKSGGNGIVTAASQRSVETFGVPSLKMVAFAAADPAQHGVGGGGGGHGGGGGTGGGGGKGGGGTTGGGTTGGGSKGGGSGAAGFSNANAYASYNQPRQIVPPFPSSASDNQQILYQLADGTGGFVILNTNDLIGGLEKIAKDQNQYYLLGYKPEVSVLGSCHSLKVKVERGGTNVRARSGYCNSKPVDILAGNPVEKDLETRGAGEMKGNIVARMQAPFFYVGPNTAQVHFAMEMPPAALRFDKVKGKEHATLNILGIAYKPDGSIAARFSDTVNLDLDAKKEVEEFEQQPFRYENQFGIASGEYKLRVVFSSGNENFGVLETPLLVDRYGAQDFSLSALAVSKEMRRTANLSTELDSQLLEDRTPLVFQGLQISPSGSNVFKKTDPAAIYAEVYEPLLAKPNPPDVAYEMIVVDTKSGKQKVHIGDRTPKGNTGNPVIPLAVKLPVATLGPGSYRLDLRAVDQAGNSSKTRSVEFEVE